MFAMFAMFVQTQLTSHPSPRIHHHHGSHNDDDEQHRPTGANEGQQRLTQASRQQGLETRHISSPWYVPIFHIFYFTY
jgi:hypothetical protein